MPNLLHFVSGSDVLQVYEDVDAVARLRRACHVDVDEFQRLSDGLDFRSLNAIHSMLEGLTTDYFCTLCSRSSEDEVQL